MLTRQALGLAATHQPLVMGIGQRDMDLYGYGTILEKNISKFHVLFI